ncbi:MAG TPA: DHA2 family efflux MFS transporter permease subunit, partial [Bryobacteraceae bacterium]|nr:DHA2 family efflux MFS transporter permease subunit [Bryobacteraceae bacterium]
AIGTFTLWLGFTAMCLGLFMAVLDIQVVASALTTIGAALHIAPERLGWIQTGYLMAEVIAIPLTGLLTRALSLRWMFAAATFGFTLASLACAFSPDIGFLIAFRVVQGFCGGMLIPAVFTSIFVMMPREREVLATAMAGVFAVIAPTIGPFVGGYLTEHFSWNWIFLVNIVPGLIVSLTVALCVRVGEANPRVLAVIDYTTFLLMAVFLGSLELILNEAPGRHWRGAFVFTVAAVLVLSAFLAVWRALTSPAPFVDLRRFKNRAFSLGCALSFVFGMGLYGSVYMLALFLGLVRGHSPLEIGEVMMVSGAAQLVMAPLAAILEPRLDARLLTAVGFLLFGFGLYANGLETPRSEFWGLLWPQILRGAAVMLCILPVTRLALEGWSAAEVPECSGIFNLMRNLGGAIGIALIDTLIQSRTEGHFMALGRRLQAGDASAAALVGLPTQMFRGHDMGPVDEATKEMVAPLIQRAALTQSLNEGWLLLAALFALALLLVPMMKGAGARSGKV